MFASVVLLCNVLVITPVLAAPNIENYASFTPEQQSDATELSELPLATTGIPISTFEPDFTSEIPVSTVEPTVDCPVCLQIVNVAMHHISDKNPTLPELQKQLQQECVDLEQRDGPAAVQHCLYIVNTNIAQLYDDIVNKHLTPYKTCQDIQQC